MQSIQSLLTEYGHSHQNQTNKKVHWICVPLIFLSIVGLFWSIPNGGLQEITTWNSPYMNWASIALLLVMIYYLALSIPLAVGMALFSILCLIIIRQIEIFIPWPVWAVSLVIFSLAWIGQFYGHKIEGKKPSFLKDVQFLLIGPAWLMHFIYKKIGIPY
jgi:uncharacterized membrane protein YGL010W